jgi:hypothetical protein
MRVLLVAALLLAAPASALDLIGTWHVIAHYKDSQAHNPEAERWEDRVWVFELDPNGRLRWTDYPIVVFDDKTGRFERSSTNRAARVVHYWEPNEAQLAEIAAGPMVNARGSRSKRLRGSPETGWRSTASAGAPSASIITFTANWSIDEPTGLPVFRQEDVMGSGLSETMEGGSLWETASVEEDGSLLRGRFDRDGARIGTFAARRTVATRGLGTEEEQEKRLAEKRAALFGLDQLRGQGTLMDEATIQQELVRAAQEGTLSDEDRKELSKTIRASVEAGMRAQGLSPRDLRTEVSSLTRQIEELYLEGKTSADIEAMFREGKLRP